jgi:hypothetical protein
MFLDCRHVYKTCAFHHAVHTGKQKEAHPPYSPDLAPAGAISGDLFDIFLSSISVLTPNGQFFNCAIIAFSESDVMSGKHTRAFGAVLLKTQGRC